MPAVVVEGAHPGALLAQQVQVDVGDGAAVAVGEAVGLGEQDAVLVDQGLAVPGQVGGGLALAGGGVDVGGQAPAGLGADQQAAVLGAAHGDRRARQVDQHGRPGQRGLGARRDRHPDVLADLGVQHQPGDVGGGEEQVGAERDLLAADRDLAGLVVAGGELAALVELAVGRQVGLRRHPEHPAAVHHDGAVVDAVAVPEGGADDEHRQQVAGALDHGGQGGLDGVQQRVLQQQVLDRVAGEGQLGEDGDRDAVLVAGPGLAEDGVGVGRRVGQRGALRARGDAREPVPVDRGEPHGDQCRAPRPPPSAALPRPGVRTARCPRGR